MSEKRYYQITAKDEPNIGVVAFRVKEHNDLVLTPDRAKDAFIQALTEHFDAEVTLEGKFPTKFVVGCEVTIPVLVDSTNKYNYDITVRHTWLYE